MAFTTVAMVLVLCSCSLAASIANQQTPEFGFGSDTTKDFSICRHLFTDILKRVSFTAIILMGPKKS